MSRPVIKGLFPKAPKKEIPCGNPVCKFKATDRRKYCSELCRWDHAELKKEESK